MCDKALKISGSTGFDPNDPVLKRLRAALGDMHGEKMERVVLFAARAPARIRIYDVAIFLHDLSDLWYELDRPADLRAEFLEDAGVFIHGKPYPAGAYCNPTILMRELGREGIGL